MTDELERRSESEASPHQSGSAGRWVVLVLLAFAGWALYNFLPSRTEGLKASQSLGSSETLVTAVRGLSRLETAELRLSKVIDLRDKQSRVFGLVESEDAILLIAAARVTAGVDLSLVKAEQLQIDEQKRRVTIELPRATLLSVALDNDSTYVYSRTTDALAKRDEHLETKARSMAEQMLRTSAVESDILSLAEGNAARVLTALVRSLGYAEVEVVYDNSAQVE